MMFYFYARAILFCYKYQERFGNGQGVNRHVTGRFAASGRHAQVVNSLSKDKTGFYGHALDSVISIIKENKALRAVYVGGGECVKSYLPDTLQGVVIKWKPPRNPKKEN